MKTSVALLPAWLCAAAAAAQNPPPAEGQGDTPPRLYDFTAALVGDRAVLGSQVNELWASYKLADEELPEEARQLTTSLSQRLRWYHLLDLLVAQEIQSQSLRLMGRSPEELEAQVERIVQAQLEEQTAAAGGLIEFTRQLGVLGQSMSSVVDRERTRVRQQLAAYQGILAELRDQMALLVTPREMVAELRRSGQAYRRPGHAELRFARFPLAPDPDAAREQANAQRAAWLGLPRPLQPGALGDQAAVRVALGGRDGTRPVLRQFAEGARPGDVSAVVEDDSGLWVLVCVEREEPRAPDFADPDVQEEVRRALEQRKLEKILSRMFEEHRLGVERLPFGPPERLEPPAQSPSRAVAPGDGRR